MSNPQPSNAQPRVKILFIGGFGRSGTTILDNVLGQVEGFFSAGETLYIWDRSFIEDRLCGCRRPFSQCPTWQSIAAEIGPRGDTDKERHEELQAWVGVRESLTPKRVALASRRRQDPDSLPGVADYRARMVEVYRTIQRQTGCEVIVDSSKSPGHGYLLQGSPELDAYAVHIVRDPRAVAFSWQKKKVYDPSGDKPMMMSRHSPARSSKLWNTWNLATEAVWKKSPDQYMRILYEDFMADPHSILQQVLDHIGASQASLDFVRGNQVSMGEIHALAGNPSRFNDGTVELRRDDRWRNDQPAWHRRLVTLLTYPLLRRYGYLGKPK